MYLLPLYYYILVAYRICDCLRIRDQHVAFFVFDKGVSGNCDFRLWYYRLGFVQLVE